MPLRCEYLTSVLKHVQVNNDACVFLQDALL